MRYFSVLLTIFAIFSTAITLSFEQQMEHEQFVFIVEAIESHFVACRQFLQQLTSNHPNVLNQFDLFAETLKHVYLSGEGLIDKDIHRIIDGVAFSAEKHRDQVRKNPDQTPYIIHPIGVANHLMIIGKVRDADIIIAALLHDTVEDTQTTGAEIEHVFGARVAGFVQEVTDDKSLSQQVRKRRQIEHASEKSAGAAQIKLGDKLDNLLDLIKVPPLGWNEERVDNYFRWAKEVVDHLPWVNAPLHQAIHEVIERYWQNKRIHEDFKL